MDSLHACAYIYQAFDCENFYVWLAYSVGIIIFIYKYNALRFSSKWFLKHTFRLFLGNKIRTSFFVIIRLVFNCVKGTVLCVPGLTVKKGRDETSCDWRRNWRVLSNCTFFIMETGKFNFNLWQIKTTYWYQSIFIKRLKSIFPGKSIYKLFKIGLGIMLASRLYKACNLHDLIAI